MFYPHSYYLNEKQRKEGSNGKRLGENFLIHSSERFAFFTKNKWDEDGVPAWFI